MSKPKFTTKAKKKRGSMAFDFWTTVYDLENGTADCIKSTIHIPSDLAVKAFKDLGIAEDQEGLWTLPPERLSELADKMREIEAKDGGRNG